MIPQPVPSVNVFSEDSVAPADKIVYNGGQYRKTTGRKHHAAHQQGKLLSEHRPDGAGTGHLSAPGVRGHHRENDEIISTGYNGAPRGRRNCVDMGYCTRERLQVPRGERYELCRSVHAEANAIISASRRDMVGGTLYLVGRNAQTGELLPDATSCPMCRRHIINAGLERVVIRRTPTEFQVVDVQDWIDSEDDVPQA